MNIIKINTGIERIPITNENDEVIHTLIIDTKDNRYYQKFKELVDRVLKLEKNAKLEIKMLQNEEGKIKEKDALEYNDKYTSEVIDLFNAFFGSELLKDVLKEHYEIDSDYKPDITVIVDLITGIMPVVQEIFGQKNAKYSPNRKGGRNV